MANKSESIDERMERKRLEFEQRKAESKKRMEEHRESVQNGKTIGDLSIKVDIDVSDALKGLKAVQREAKKTVRVLREVEGMSPEHANSMFSDDDILQELSKRGWKINEHGLMDDYGMPVKKFVEMHIDYNEKANDEVLSKVHCEDCGSDTIHWKKNAGPWYCKVCRICDKETLLTDDVWKEFKRNEMKE